MIKRTIIIIGIFVIAIISQAIGMMPKLKYLSKTAAAITTGSSLLWSYEEWAYQTNSQAYETIDCATPSNLMPIDSTFYLKTLPSLILIPISS